MKITRRQLRKIIREATMFNKALVSKKPLTPEEEAVIDRPIPDDMHPDLVEELQEYQNDYIKMYNDIFDLSLDKASLYKPKDKYAWEKKSPDKMTAWEKIQYYKQDMPYALETMQGLWSEYDNSTPGTRK